MSTLEILLLTAALTIMLMYWVWVLAVRINNFSIVDAAWAFCFFLQTVLFSFMATELGAKRVIFLILVTLWSLRLAFFLALRLRRHHPQEDTRYQQLRVKYGASYRSKFFVFYIWQALSVSILAAPFVVVFAGENTNLSMLEIIGATLFLLSFAGEFIADRQMSQFKSRPQNRGQVCNVGLWRYSRHPNYFFESCIWWSFYIFIMGSGYQYWWAAYAPLTILYLLLKVTGVPPAEAQSLQTRGEAYREYQQRTSVFVPWFNKKTGKEHEKK